MNEEKFPQRRRYPRFRVEGKFRLKARVRLMGKRETHYLEVQTLSMGGALLVSNEGVPMKIEEGATLEILCYTSSISFRCVARVANHQLAQLEKETAIDQPLCVRMGLEVIGIDEKSRAILAQFLDQLARTSGTEPK